MTRSGDERAANTSQPRRKAWIGDRMSALGEANGEYRLILLGGDGRLWNISIGQETIWANTSARS